MYFREVLSVAVNFLISLLATTSLHFFAVDQATASEPHRSGFRDVFTFAIVGDAGWSHPAAFDLRNSIRRSKIKDLILPGDNIYQTQLTYAEVWGPWLADGFHFSVPAIGNHTLGYEAEAKFFNMPGEFYARKIGQSRFIVLNSDNVSTAHLQSQWLKEELTRATEKIVFVVFHHPPLTVSNRHSWQERREFHEAVRPVLYAHLTKITAVIVGHDHLAGLFDLNGVPLIVSGAAIETHFAKVIDTSSPEGLRLKSRWLYAGQRTWARLDVNETTGHVWLNFVDMENDRVSCSALLSVRPMQLKKNCAQKSE